MDLLTVTQQLRLNQVEDTLMSAYVDAIGNIMPQVIKTSCYGCNLLEFESGKLYNHPSPEFHNICHLEKKEQTAMCFDIALERVDDSEELYSAWFEQLGKMDPPATPQEFVKYLCKDWRLTEWMTEVWRNKVTEAIRQNM